MFYATHLIGFGAGVSAPTALVSFTDSTVSASNLSTYTFSSQSLGTAAADRKIVVGIGFVTTGSVSSMTIGGVSASRVGSTVSGSGGVNIELWQADVPTGTTGDVVANLAGASDRCGIGVWAVYGAESAEHDTATGTTTPAADPTIDVPAGGVCIGFAADNSAGTDTFTWTGLTENFDELVEGPQEQTGASAAFSALQTGLVVKADASDASTTGAMIAASWGPA